MATKFLFSDIDGTLIHRGSINALTVQKIKDFVEAGNEFFLCSGRMDYEIVDILKTIKMLTSSFRISQNGSVITNSKNQILDVVKIPQIVIPYILEQALRLQAENNIHFEISDAENRYIMVDRPDYFYADILGRLIKNPNLPQDLLTGTIQPTIILFISNNEDILLELQKSLLSQYKDLIEVVFSSPYSLEILSKQASKGNAITKILKDFYPNTNLHNVYVVGDSENDISMLKQYSNSFVMNNAKPHVKAVANYGAYLVADVIDYINDQDKNLYSDLKSDKNFVSLKKQLLIDYRKEFANCDHSSGYTMIFQDLATLAEYKTKYPHATVIYQPVITDNSNANDSFIPKTFMRKVKDYLSNSLKKKLVVNHSYSLLLEQALSKHSIDIIYLNASMNSPYYSEISYLIKVSRSINPKIIIIASVTSMLEASKAQQLGVNMISFAVNNVNEFIIDKLCQIINIALILEVTNLDVSSFKILYNPKIWAIKYSSSAHNILTKGRDFINQKYILLPHIKIFETNNE